jgi:hypothetical protein
MNSGQRVMWSILGLVSLTLAACGGAASSEGAGTSATSTPSATASSQEAGTSTTSTTSETTTTPSTAPSPTLGTANPLCQGCGEVAPAKVTLQGYTQDGSVFGGLVFTQVQWQAWDSHEAIAPTTHAYFVSPGESGTVTLYAFDLGTCGTTYGYRALEWVGNGSTFDPSMYYDTCTAAKA